MSWEDDDDEWDADDLDKQLEEQQKEKEKQRRIDEGLDSESDDEPPPQPKAAPKPKPKPKKVASKSVEEPAPVLDKQAEKLRLRKLEEEADARLANDLFSGFEKPEEAQEKEEQEKKEREEAARKAAAKPKVIIKDAFDNVSLDVQADVENLCETCCTKLDKGKARGSSVKFLSDCLKQLEDVLDMKELTEMEKLLADLVKQKKAEKGAVDAKNNKANTKLNKNTKFNTASEWEEVYGGGEGDEQWTQEEWDEWQKEQEVAAGGKY